MPGTHNELDTYNASLQTRLRQISEVVASLDTSQLNWRPPFEHANSVWALAAHAEGNAHAWILGIAAGNERRRDRPGEFASAGDDPASMVASLDHTAAELETALAALDPARLDVRLVPSQELWGEGPPREISVRDAIIQVIEHLSLHLGHMHVTRDMLMSSSGGGS